MIVCFDFDDTMTEKLGSYPIIGDEHVLMMNVIKKHIKDGDTIILNTMREGELLQEAVDWLEERGIVPDAINDNCEELKNKYQNNPRKISCDINYDDKNFEWNSNYTDRCLRELVGGVHPDIIDRTCSECKYWCGTVYDGFDYLRCSKHNKFKKHCYWCKDWESKEDLNENQ